MSIRRSAAVGALALIAGLTVCPTATGAVLGLAPLEFSPPLGSPTFQGEPVNCLGHRVIGGGGQLSGGSGEARLKQVLPSPDLTEVTVQGHEDANGFTGQWSASTIAICAMPPPGLQRAAATSPRNSANKSVTASCPPGKRVLGTGGAVVGAGGGVILHDLRPAAGSVTVRGLEAEGGVAANWRVKAIAVCANPVSGLERVVATSATDSNDKLAIAPCSPGKRVLGAGAEIAGGGGGQIGLDAVAPDQSLESVTVAASEDEDGTPATWFVRAYAICGDVAERELQFSPLDSLDKAETAVCDTGLQPIGGGGDITGGLGQALLEDLQPASGGMFVQAREDGDGLAGNWSMRAYAICHSPIPGIERIGATSVSDSDDSKGATVTCPVGKRVVAAGGAISNGIGEVALRAVVPNAELTEVTAAGVEDDTGYAGSWTVSAYAVCAFAPRGLELVEETVGPDSDPASVIADCPSDKQLLGTGALIVQGGTDVVLDDVRPESDLSGVTVTALEDQTGFSGQWFLRAHAICASY